MLTVKQLCKKMHVDYLVASSLIKVMVKQGLAKECGKVGRPGGGKGKPSTLFDIPNRVTLSLFEPSLTKAIVPTILKKATKAKKVTKARAVVAPVVLVVPAIEPAIEPVADPMPVS